MLSLEARKTFGSVLHSVLYDPNSANRADKFGNPVTRWIYEDRPRLNDLNKNSYPRISIDFTGLPNEFRGFHSTDRVLTLSKVRAIIEVWIYPDHRLTYPVEQPPAGSYINAKLRDRLASDVKVALENKAQVFKQNGIVIIAKTITEPENADVIGNSNARTHYHSEVRCEFMYPNLGDTS